MKKEKPLSLITDEEIPFDIPSHWKFVRTGDVIDCSSGSTPLKGHPEYYENGTIPWLKTGELNNSYITKCEEKITELAYEKGSFRMNQPGDVLIAMYGATIGKLGICTFPLTTNQACLGCTPLGGINNRYLFYFFMASKSSLTDKAEGGAQPNISRIKVRNHPMPLPPIEEQARIVARVDELMTKIDEYEKIERELTELQKAFPGNMKDAILQAAFEGKLSEATPSDSELNIKSSFSEEEPYGLPEHWKWCCLGDVVWNRKQKKPDKTFSYIDIGSIDNEHQKLNNKETIIEAEKAPSRARKTVEIGDILYSTVRPYLHNMAIVDRSFSHEPIASTGFAAMVCNEGINNRYLFNYLKSPYFDRYANDTDNSKGVAYPAINDKKLYAAPIPVCSFENSSVSSTNSISFCRCANSWRRWQHN